MKSIHIIDGKVCIVKEITANNNLPTIKRELLFSIEQLLCALEQRMDACINALHEAEQMDLVTDVTEHQVFYIDKSQSVRTFNIPSFAASSCSFLTAFFIASNDGLLNVRTDWLLSM